jgi:pimeloyl-ACP methyl ester carboxylesterase
MRRRISFVTIVAIAACCAPAAAAAVPERLSVVPTPAGPGPAAYNQVEVHEFGPRKAKNVLVLMPGTIGGAGDFTLAARHLVKSVRGLQVWAIDRRSQALEQTAVFEQAERGEVSLQYMFDYYLGWLSNGGNPPGHFTFLNGDDYPFARDWGMAVALNDARAVVLKARRKGKRNVALGGHSLGASLTVAYAAWDFNGRPGYKDLDGLVLIDGGLLGSFDAYTLAEAQQQVGDLEGSNPFFDLLNLGFPEITGLFAEIGGISAEREPTASATTLQSFPLLPPAFNPPYPVTNRALFGHAFDRDSSPPGLGLIHINAGGFPATGSPRDWIDGGVSPVARLAATFGQEPTNAVEWYFPRRLTIDTNGANEMRQNDVAQFLGLRLLHTKKVDLPFYSIQTDLTDGRVLEGSRNFIRRSRTTRKESVLVNAAPEQSHLDPLVAGWNRNRFFKTVVPFLRDRVFADVNPKPNKKGRKG